MASTDPEYPDDVETTLATLAAVCAAQGRAREVAVLAAAEARIEHSGYDNFNNGIDFYTLHLEIPADLYARIAEHREALQRSLEGTAREIGRWEREVISDVRVIPARADPTNWRHQAVAWLRGEGITNQGRVRSDNIAARSADGLLFRSEPEIMLYRALKSLGASFAPLPVFVRGGATYQRIEPDFVIVRDGLMLVAEVDGDTVHRETPAEAHARTKMLADEGVVIERVQASHCDTPEKALVCARQLLDTLQKAKRSRS